MDILEIEKRLNIEFPERHRRALMDTSDPIHKECDFFVPDSSNPALQFLQTNEWLHSSKVWSPWPDFLVAFASQGCGDYFAYDSRRKPYSIIYVEPDRTIEENLKDVELRYDSFEKWYESQIAMRLSSEYRAASGEQ